MGIEMDVVQTVETQTNRIRSFLRRVGLYPYKILTGLCGHCRSEKAIFEWNGFEYFWVDRISGDGFRSPVHFQPSSTNDRCERKETHFSIL